MAANAVEKHIAFLKECEKFLQILAEAPDLSSSEDKVLDSESLGKVEEWQQTIAAELKGSEEAFAKWGNNINDDYNAKIQKRTESLKTNFRSDIVSTMKYRPSFSKVFYDLTDISQYNPSPSLDEIVKRVENDNKRIVGVSKELVDRVSKSILRPNSPEDREELDRMLEEWESASDSDESDLESIEGLDAFNEPLIMEIPELTKKSVVKSSVKKEAEGHATQRESAIPKKTSKTKKLMDEQKGKESLSAWKTKKEKEKIENKKRGLQPKKPRSFREMREEKRKPVKSKLFNKTVASKGKETKRKEAPTTNEEAHAKKRQKVTPKPKRK